MGGLNSDICGSMVVTLSKRTVAKKLKNLMGLLELQFWISIKGYSLGSFWSILGIGLFLATGFDFIRQIQGM